MKVHKKGRRCKKAMPLLCGYVVLTSQDKKVYIMEQLIEMANSLGRRIAAHERTLLLKEAQKAVNEDGEAGGLIKQYQQQAEKIGQLEQEHKPVEVTDKHKLREIEQKISTNEKLKELTRRQVDFVEMMHKVKQTLDDELQLEQ